MIKFIYEGLPDSHFSCDSAVTAGTFCMLDTENDGKVVVSDGSAVFGVFAEDMKEFAFGDYRSPVKPVQNLGDKIGVYHQHGVYVTDVFVEGTYAPGTKLYVTNVGKLTATYNATVSATAGAIQVGTVIKASTTEIMFDLAI